MRVSEETNLKPTPMIEVVGKLVLWHVIKTHSHYGVNKFVFSCGFKGCVIKLFFANYFLHMSDVTFDILNTLSHPTISNFKLHFMHESAKVKMI